MKSFVLFTLTLLSLQATAKADGVLSGRETINLPPAINPGNSVGDCITAAVLTLDYDKLTALVQETVTSGTCPSIDPNGKLFKINKVSVGIDEEKGVSVYIAGRASDGSGLFFMHDYRKWHGPFTHGLPLLMVDSDMGDRRSPRWAIGVK